MRASQWLLGLATTSAIVGAVAAGCGGSTNSGTPVKEAGPDVTADVAKEAAPEAAAETGPADAASEACAFDGEVAWPPITDAAFGDTGINEGTCLACVEGACPDLISQCNASCACKEAFGQFESCFAAGGSLETCGAELATGGGLSFTDLECALPCASTCGISTSEGGSDGGGDASSDGPTE